MSKSSHRLPVAMSSGAAGHHPADWNWPCRWSLRAALWAIDDQFTPRLGGAKRIDAYVGEETGPAFPGSDWCLTLGAATIQAAASEVGRGAWTPAVYRGLPGSATWPPAWYGVAVLVVLGAEALAERRLLVPVDGGGEDQGGHRGPPEQGGLRE